MKKLYFETVGVIFGIVFFIVIVAMVGSTFNTYEREAIVTEVYENEVICRDRQRQEWSFFGEGYSKGDEIVLIMKDNETVGIKDDTIIKVKEKREKEK